MHMLWCWTDICSCKLCEKVSPVLDNPYTVPSLCKLNDISDCFIQISTRITCKQLIPFFFEVIHGVLGHLVNFNMIYRFLLRWPVLPDYPFPCDYALCKRYFTLFKVFPYQKVNMETIIFRVKGVWKILHSFLFPKPDRCYVKMYKILYKLCKRQLWHGIYAHSCASTWSHNRNKNKMWKKPLLYARCSL